MKKIFPSCHFPTSGPHLPTVAHYSVAADFLAVVLYDASASTYFNYCAIFPQIVSAIASELLYAVV